MANFNTNDKENTEKINLSYDDALNLRDELTEEHSLWKRLEGKELTSEQLDFLNTCMVENLNHARHVENERLTFNTVFLALVAGVLAFGGEIQNNLILVCVYGSVTVAGFLSMLLTARWNNAFDRHQFYAKQCYKLIHKQIFGDAGSDKKADDVEWEALDNFNDIPMYCFSIHKPIAHNCIGRKAYEYKTKSVYNAFYAIVQLLLIASTILAAFGFIGE